MPQSQHGALRVRDKTAEVLAYHCDDESPGRPLYLLIPGGLLALTSLALMIWIAYATWYRSSLHVNDGVLVLLLLAPVYAGSIFLFSYGYELYDVPKALRLTAILVFFAFAAVIILAVLFALLSKSDTDASSCDTSSSRSSGSSYWNSTRSGSWSSGSGSIDFGGLHTNTVTREVVREVPVPPAPVVCSYCGTSFLPVVGGALVCPSCGGTQARQVSPDNVV
jgi:hypothetical protein